MDRVLKIGCHSRVGQLVVMVFIFGLTLHRWGFLNLNQSGDRPER
jgi:hypothetical protein